MPSGPRFAACSRTRRPPTSAGPVEEADREPIQKAGRTLHPLDKEGVWWFEKGDLVLSNQPDVVLAVLDGKAPSAVDHPRRIALLKARDDFQPVAAGFVDLSELPPMPAEAVQLGLDGLKQVEIQWGFQDDALVSVLGVVAPEPRQGILALLDQPTFTIRSLPPLPAGLSGFTALSIDPLKTYDQIVAVMKKANPPAADQIPAVEEMIRQRFGLDIRNDLLPSLGPKLAFYAQPAAADAATRPGDGDARSVHRADAGSPGPGPGRIDQGVRSVDADDQRHPPDAAGRPERPGPGVPQTGRPAPHLRARSTPGRSAPADPRHVPANSHARQGSACFRRHHRCRRTSDRRVYRHAGTAAGRPPARSFPWPGAFRRTWCS